jgi:hypothetical protein
MRVLAAGRDAGVRPELAWSRQVQARVKTLLAAGRTRLEAADAAAWRTLKAGWRDLVLERAAGLLALDRTPPRAQLLRETAHEGFRLQSLVFESFPGWKVGLNLFLPVGPGPFVPVICPCGHGPKGQADHQVPPQVLARAGFAAALFDMPMFGEKVRGNDHFIQGSQAGMTGTWANLYFLADALRAADLLLSRPDIDSTRGIGVTGVSGGGVAAMYLAVLDPRVRALAPACCTASLGGHVVDGLYTGCPETFVDGQVRAGMDLDHLLCLAAPLPCLVAGARGDTMYRPELVEHSVAQARRVYELEGAAGRISLFLDNGPHAYTPAMAGAVASWFRHWLRGLPPAEPVGPATLLDPDELDCGTGHETEAMLEANQHAARRLREDRAAGSRVARGDAVSVEAALTDAAIDAACRVRLPGPDTVTVLPRPAWGHPGLDRLVIRGNDDLDLPVLSCAFPEAPAGTLACFVPADKLSPLTQREGFYGVRRRIVSADLRGFGELRPEPSAYDLYSWCSVDRPLADLLILCGECALGEQVRDALRVLAATGGDGDLTVYGRGEAALAALFAGLLEPRVTGIALDSFPCSFESIATAESPAWSRWAFVPDVLEHFDLPDLVRGRTDRRFLLHRPCGADAAALTAGEADALYRPLPGHVTLHAGLDLPGPASALAAWLGKETP